MTAFPESHRDLLDVPVGVLSTNGATGVPQSSVVWFVHHDDEITIWLSDARQKTKNLLRDPVCSFLIVDLANPYRYLAVRGPVECTPDTDFAVGALVSAKYDMDARTMLAEGETRYAVTVHPTSVYVR